MTFIRQKLPWWFCVLLLGGFGEFIVPLGASQVSLNSVQGYSIFSTLDTVAGLPNASVANIAEDPLGFMWFATQGGLARYDGTNFDLFENSPFSTNVLSHNQTQTLFMDGYIAWVGTYGGLNRFDTRTGDVQVWRHNPDQPNSLSNDLVICIARDALGRLWVGTQNGLNLMDEQRGTFIRYFFDQNDASSPPGNIIRTLYLDSKARFWVGASDGGLGLYQVATDDFLVFRHDPRDLNSLAGNAVMAITEEDDGTLWFGIWGAGLSYLEPQVDPTLGEIRFDSILMPEENRIYTLDATDNDLVRIGTWGGGLFEYHRSNRVLFRYRAKDGPGSIAHDIVYSLYLDSRGTYWIGTNGGGISRLESDGSQYTSYIHDPAKPGTLGSGKVANILEDSKGKIWVGQYNGGLSRYDPETRLFSNYQNDPGKPRSLSSNIVNVIFEDSLGELWVGTSNGLNRFKPRTNDFDVFLPGKEIPGSAPTLVIYAIAEDKKGNLWIGTYHQGLLYWDRSSGVFTGYPPQPHSDKGPGDGLIYALAWDARDNLWIGMNNGLDRYKDGVFTHYQYNSDKPAGLSSNTIRALFLDSKERLWIGTVSGGIMRYDEQSDTFVHYLKSQGLPDNTIKSIVEDHRGTLWVGTGRGIAMLPFGEQNFRGLTLFHELKDRDFHSGAMVSREGDIWFGGTNAMYRIDPAIAHTRGIEPEVRLSRIRVGNSGDILGAGHRSNIFVPWQTNSLSLGFAIMDYSDPFRSRFSYMLQGYDKTWRVSDVRGTVDYSNLPGGSYALMAKAQNADGTWSSRVFTIPIRVAVQPWLSIPAILVYLLLLVGIGYLIALSLGKRALAEKVVELSTLRDQLENANKLLAELSLRDPLTGLSNRRRMDDMVPLLYANALREAKSIAFLMLDIDLFKVYNDNHGHLEGDKILKEIATIIDGSIERANDLAVRYGGEEFLIVLPHTDVNGAGLVADRILQEVRTKLAMTVSIGVVAGVPQQETGYLDLIQLADKTLYEAKNSGRNRVVRSGF